MISVHNLRMRIHQHCPLGMAPTAGTLHRREACSASFEMFEMRQCSVHKYKLKPVERLYLSPFTLHEFCKLPSGSVERARRYRNMTSPLNTFPPELLIQIFAIRPPQSIQFPPNYTQVCSRWRSIAYTSPELWTTLTIELLPALKTKADAAYLEEALTSWVLRSRSNIDLTVYGPFFREGWDRPSELQKRLYGKVNCKIIVKFSNKWRRLITPYTWDAHNFPHSLKHFSALEELKVAVGTCPLSTSNHSTFPKAPRLFKLNLDLPMSPSFACLESLIPETVSDLTLSSAPSMFGVSEDFMRSFLQLEQLQNLTHMDFSRVGWTTPHVLSSTILPHLQELTLGGTITALGDFLGVLTLPSLRKLSLSTSRFDGNGDHGPVVGPALIDLLKRSYRDKCGLLALSLTWMLARDINSGQAITLEALCHILSAASTITELHIHSEGHTDTARLMEILRYDGVSPEKQILPHLKCFSAESLSDLDQGYFLDFIYSRWWPDGSQPVVGVSKLEKLILSGCTLTEKTREQLDTCYNEAWEDMAAGSHIWVARGYEGLYKDDSSSAHCMEKVMNE
ncbi:hypothetical protein C8R41DRAFT_337826 [Lentinula lateritia]|uniref:F-box domain-containing protein n=1 Tax=Lentinula lateritia TaxID=40482 RepID=A0ABQ8VFR1_9AGAR|nr:hypothetical protein C8R41DRAFT_337826 [Lentinula lateritia]